MSIRTTPSLESWLQLEEMNILNPHFISHVKSQARQLQRQRDNKFSRTHALNLVSQSFGFEDWKHLQNSFNYESKGLLSAYFDNGNLNEAKDCYTVRQLHGAVYRHHKFKPLDQVVQVVFDDEDFRDACFDPFISERQALNLFLMKGLVEDRQFSDWLMKHDPFFQDFEPATFRFLHPKILTHTEALNLVEHIMQDIEFVGFKKSCWPLYIYINGSLPDDTTPPDIDDGYDDCPLLTLPPEAHPGVYE